MVVVLVSHVFRLMARRRRTAAPAEARKPHVSQEVRLLLEHTLHDIRRLKARIVRAKRYQHFRDRRVGPLAKGHFGCFDDTRSIFVHIPKSGGVSVAETLYGTRAGRHTSISQYQIVFGAADFHHYFKFTFVRNPWDRAYSAYRYLKSGAMGGQHDLDWVEQNLKGVKDFDEFIVDFLPRPQIRRGIHFRTQESFLRSAITGKVCVDFVGRFERLADDFDLVSKRIGKAVTLPHLNKSRIAGHYRDAYSSQMREIVGDVYENDVRLFEYSF
jgi:hypothetical protein